MGLILVCHGVWWITRWWWPQSKNEVFELGLAEVGPMQDVVARHRWPLAAGEGAVPVSDHQGVPDRHGHGAGRAADVEDLSSGAEEDGDDLGVTGEPAGHAGWEVEAVAGHG